MAELVTKTDLAEALDKQSLRLTVRLGSLIIGATGVLAVLMKLL